MTWWIWLVVYYILSIIFVVIIIIVNDNINDLLEIYILITFLGLGFVPIIYFLILKFIDLFKFINLQLTKYKINVLKNKNNKYDDGILKIDSYLCFNIKDKNYRGQINIDVDKISYKKMKKIIDKLTKWGQQEQLKNATLDAIKTVKNL